MDRSQSVGASEVAALFGLHPNITARMLYHRKRGELPEQEWNKAMRRGKVLEPALAELYTETTGTKIIRHQQVTPHPTIPGLACTPDYLDEAGDPQEFKTARFMKGDSAADQHVIQLNTQMDCLQRQQGNVIYYDMARDDFIICPRLIDSDMVLIVGEAVAKFWERVRDGRPPEVASGDVQALTTLFKERHIEETINLDDDLDFAGYVGEYQAVRQQRLDIEKVEDELKAKIYARMGDFVRAKFGRTEVKRTIVNMPEKVVKAHKQVRMYVKEVKG